MTGSTWHSTAQFSEVHGEVVPPADTVDFNQVASGSKLPTKRLSMTPVHQGWRGACGCVAPALCSLSSGLADGVAA